MLGRCSKPFQSAELSKVPVGIDTDFLCPDWDFRVCSPEQYDSASVDPDHARNGKEYRHSRPEPT